MKRLLWVFVFLISFFCAKASHIVGGEFELLYISGNTYRINLILYFDEINGDPDAFDNPVTVRIFRKRDNAIILNALTLQLVSRTDVGYTQLECSDGEIVTDRILYSTTVNLSSAVYTDPEGYYIAWERCCRNYGITNIFSDPQPGGAQFAGQTFYLEFPPVVKNGQPFINSSPSLFPPLNDFACPYIPYYVDFAGVDNDGDSLVYSLVTPLNTFTADALPLPNPPGLARPGPYPTVNWRPGFGLNNIMNGVTNLSITTDGFLTVTPKNAGLYVFAVRCQEFRDGVKIGEVRRDFQMLVVQAGGCPDVVNPPKPSIEGKALGGASFSTSGTLSISFANTVPIADRCFEVKVSDPSTLRPDDNFQENIKIKAVALDFKKNINEVLPAVTTDLIMNGEEAFFRICFPQECPYKPGSFQIGIVASDDACALPLTDTLRVTVTIEPPPNHVPAFSNSDEIIETIEEGDAMQSWPIQVIDADGDEIQYRLVAVGFTLEDFGMSFTGNLTGQETGTLNKTLSWNPKCDIYDFTQKTNFELYFIVNDIDDCLIKHADTTRFNLTITDFSQITPPVINNSILNNADTIEVDLKMYGDPLILDVTGSDIDNTAILLRSSGIGFNASAYGVEFPSDFKIGSVASRFIWELQCDSIDLELKNAFEFRFMVVDSLNKCKFYKADTLHMIVNILPPDEEHFVPPNVFSPNGDEKNDFFAMAQYDETFDEFVTILPEDNCYGEFISIRIYDRWGKQVYESYNRDFRWYGNGMPVGVYFYYIKYSNRDYKGIVSLRF
ncbi:MAG TPA: gliding motility-associated C-terminal domain-containing protein [Cyclobacteriaceae bacterium]|nr:gliding motility-associated C-terminal domain-containing protein [Cyclobacteriaceae bacterium]